MNPRLFLDTNILLDILIPTLKQISVLVDVLPMDAAILDKAMQLSGPDFDDILQAVCAAQGKCDLLVTHNPKHFNIQAGLAQNWTSPHIISPEEFF